MKKYRTIASVEWDCKRCGQDVIIDKEGHPNCGCIINPSPWEPKQCLNGNGDSEFILFRR